METLTADNALNRRVWGPWATIGFGLLVGITLTVIQVLTAAFFIATRIAADSSLDLAQLVVGLSSNGLVLSVETFVATIVCIGFVLIIIAVRKGVSITEYLALRPVSKRTALLLLVFTIGLIVLAESISRVSDRPPTEFMVDIYNTSVWPVLLWLALVIFAPASEEVFFRGFLLTGFKQSRLGSTGAVILISLIWAMMHIQYEIFEMTTIFSLGIVLGVARLKTGSLWSPLLMHSLWNLVSIWQVSLETAV